MIQHNLSQQHQIQQTPLLSEKIIPPQNFEDNEINKIYDWADSPIIVLHEVQSIQSDQDQAKQLQKSVIIFQEKQKTEQIYQEQPLQKCENFQLRLHGNKELSNDFLSNQNTTYQNQFDDANNFKVIVHQIQSRQSLPQDQQHRHQIQFSKSQLQIKLGSDAQPILIQENTIKAQQKVIPYRQSSEDDDFYIKFVEERWAKREQHKNQKTENTQTNNLQLNNQQIIIIKPKTVLSNLKQSQKLKPQKKTQFKVKKINDRSSCPTLNIRNIKTSNETRNQTRNLEVLKNNSELLNIQKQKYYKFSRSAKKHVSNIQSPNTSNQKKSVKRQQNMIIHYEFSRTNSIEMMSNILQDRCYNNLGHKKSVHNSIERSNLNDQSQNKIRKIIKRSPYGILEIQVKDRKNSAKITNLRILKPKQMIRLKKIPKNSKINKENNLIDRQSKIICQNVQFISRKDNYLIESTFPSIN